MANPLQSLEMRFSQVSLAAEEAHPNQMAFRGVLVRLDEPSDKAPNGSEGHRIFVSSDVARDKLRTLIGMGLNYRPGKLDGHAQQHKVGVITKAWIDGQDLWVKGHVWKHDFPDASQDLKQRGLGMSMEIGDVRVDDVDAQVWKLTDFVFLGATILWKDAAAYHKTQAIAASKERSNSMVKKDTKTPSKAAPVDQELIASIAAQAGAAVAKSVVGVIARQTEMLTQINHTLEILAGKKEEDEEAGSDVDNIKTKKKEEDDEEDDEEAACKMSSSKKKEEDDEEDDEDEDDMESATDEGDLDKMGPDTADPGNDEPGKLSEQTTNKGSKTTSEDKTGKTVSKGVTGSAVRELVKQVNRLTKKVAALEAENDKLRDKHDKINAQVQLSAAEVNRRSLSPELVGLLAKSGLDVDELRQSRTKLTPAEVDAVLEASGVRLDITKRVETKNRLIAAGLMDEGRVDRGITAGL